MGCLPTLATLLHIAVVLKGSGALALALPRCGAARPLDGMPPRSDMAQRAAKRGGAKSISMLWKAVNVCPPRTTGAHWKAATMRCSAVRCGAMSVGHRPLTLRLRWCCNVARHKSATGLLSIKRVNFRSGTCQPIITTRQCLCVGPHSLAKFDTIAFSHQPCAAPTHHLITFTTPHSPPAR